MDNETILKKAIEKAVKGGWEAEHWAKGIMCECNIITTRYNYYKFIFLHSFAKAFWSKRNLWLCDNCEHTEYREREILCRKCKGEGEMNYKGYEYQYHLQQMVLEKEPLKYLEKFL